MDATICVNQEENGLDSRYDRFNLCMLFYIPCEAGYKIERFNFLFRWYNQDVNKNNYQREKNLKTSGKQCIWYFCFLY